MIKKKKGCESTKQTLASIKDSLVRVINPRSFYNIMSLETYTHFFCLLVLFQAEFILCLLDTLGSMCLSMSHHIDGNQSSSPGSLPIALGTLH